jgi:hypothetical protein
MEFLLNHPWPFGLSVAFVLAISVELGHRTTRVLKILADPERKDQIVTIRDGFFVLVSLLLGFTLALSAQRFVERRSLLVDEVVSIGTTYLRASTVAQPYGDQSQQLLREYVAARLDLDNAGLDETQFDAAATRSKRIQEQLWDDVIALTQVDRSAVATAYITSLNEMIDLHDKRVAALENRIPGSIWFLLVAVSMVTVFTRGLTLGSRFWLTFILVPLTISIVLALIADIDSPSSGMIRQDQRAMQRLKSELATEGKGG